MTPLTYMFIGKAARVFVFGLVSIMTPIYMATLGYSPLYVGLALAAIIAGNIVSNILLTWYGDRLGRRRSLLVFSFLMLVSGILLYATTFLPLMMLAYFLGNISTTGTETGPFQSIEAGMLPNMVPDEKRNRAFGVYNFIGYGASSIGAFAASAPSYFQNDLVVFRSLYLIYGFVGLLLLLLYRRLGNIESTRTESRELGLEGYLRRPNVTSRSCRLSFRLTHSEVASCLSLSFRTGSTWSMASPFRILELSS